MCSSLFSVSAFVSTFQTIQGFPYIYLQELFVEYMKTAWGMECKLLGVENKFDGSRGKLSRLI